jgi:hypothetical protein
MEHLRIFPVLDILLFAFLAAEIGDPPSNKGGDSLLSRQIDPAIRVPDQFL